MLRLCKEILATITVMFSLFMVLLVVSALVLIASLGLLAIVHALGWWAVLLGVIFILIFISIRITDASDSILEGFNFGGHPPM